MFGSLAVRRSIIIRATDKKFKLTHAKNIYSQIISSKSRCSFIILAYCIYEIYLNIDLNIYTYIYIHTYINTCIYISNSCSCGATI